MQSHFRTWLDWLWGPVLGVAIISWTFAENVGPGVGLLFILTGISFIIIVPVIQFALIRTKLFHGQLGEAGAASIFFIIIFMVLWAASGAFSSW